MTPARRPQGYSRLQIALHWGVALVVVATWASAEGMGRVLRQRIAGGLDPVADAPLHVWLGSGVLALVAVRLVLRLVRGAPAAQGPRALALAARIGHLALYAALLAVPLGGLAVWGLGLREAGEIHALAGNALLLLAGGHAVAALLHEALRGDGTLSRMVFPRD